MEISDLKKTIIVQRIKSEKVNISEAIKWVSSIQISPEIHFVKSELTVEKDARFLPIPENLKACIVDFESDFFAGFMVQKYIYQYYVSNLDSNSLELLYLTIFKILKVFNQFGFVAFSFSPFELINLQKFLARLEVKGFDPCEYRFVNELIVNLQEKSKYESLTEALYALGYLTTKDPLFRNVKSINFLFETRNFREIIAHNQNCLKNECLILLRRFIKKYDTEVYS